MSKKIWYPDQSSKETKEPKPKKPRWYRQAERLLRSYKHLPYEIDNLRLQLRLDQLAGPSITSQYKQAIAQSSGHSSPTEHVVLKEESLEEKLERKEILLQMLENAIKTFDPEEYQVYQLRYEVEKREKEVYMKLQMSRSSYHELQRRVCMKAAMILNIPVPCEAQPNEWTGDLFQEEIPGHFPDISRT